MLLWGLVALYYSYEVEPKFINVMQLLLHDFISSQCATCILVDNLQLYHKTRLVHKNVGILNYTRFTSTAKHRDLRFLQHLSRKDAA